MTLEWEEIEDDDDYVLRRVSVLGGWLVMLAPKLQGSSGHPNVRGTETSITFIPDSNHMWGVPDKEIE